MIFSFQQKSLVSIDQLSKEEILSLLEKAKRLKEKKPSPFLQGKILASCFFEPSTRTRLSFEAAMIKLGGSVIGFSNVESTSSKKGESFQDTIKMISNYADVVVLRHFLEGASKLAAESCSIPIINAGDGKNEHPTQTLIDLFTIFERKGSLNDLHIGIVGDLKNGRAAHSLALGLSHFNARLYFVSPPSLTMPDSICYKLKRRGIKFSSHKEISSIGHKWDILYMTRLQKERTSSWNEEYLSITREEVLHLNPYLSVLHPMPRTEEMDRAIDSLPQAAYFDQAKNALFVRQALISELLKEAIHV